MEDTMSYAIFYDNNFYYFNKINQLLFSTDNTHNALFHYIYSDLSKLPDLLKDYISRIINTQTLELKNSQNNKLQIEEIEELKEILEILERSHIYYKYEYKKIITTEIGDYFNQLLVYLVHTEKKIPLETTTANGWYIERLRQLIPDSLLPDETYHSDFYNIYRKIVGADEDDECEVLITDIYKPTGFTKEISFQKEIYNVLYFILDISARGIEKMPLNQRIYLYDNMFYTPYHQTVINVTKRIRFRSQLQPQLHSEHCPENDRNIKDVFNRLYRNSTLNVGHDGIPSELEDDFNLAINYIKTITSNTIYEEYEINTLHELLYLEIFSMIQSDTMIRKCKNCGKYFTVSNRKIMYCDRIDKSGKSCSNIGSQNTFQKKLEQDEALNMYNRAYKTHHARLRLGKVTSEEHEMWLKEAKIKLEKTRNGELDISLFQQWLKK